jgi:hypothetical protein
MDSTTITEIIAYTLPSLITGSVAYFLFDSHLEPTKHEKMVTSDNQKVNTCGYRHTKNCSWNALIPHNY